MGGGGGRQAGGRAGGRSDGVKIWWSVGAEPMQIEAGEDFALLRDLH